MRSADYTLIGGLAFIAAALLSVRVYVTTQIARRRRQADSQPLPEIDLPAIPKISDGPERAGDVARLLFEYEATLRNVGNLFRQHSAETSVVRKQGLGRLLNQSTTHMQSFRSAALNELVRDREASASFESED